MFAFPSHALPNFFGAFFIFDPLQTENFALKTFNTDYGNNFD
jgi:hypothetical protein